MTGDPAMNRANVLYYEYIPYADILPKSIPEYSEYIPVLHNLYTRTYLMNTEVNMVQYSLLSSVLAVLLYSDEINVTLYDISWKTAAGRCPLHGRV